MLLEWRWLKDRAALEIEARAEREQLEAAFDRRRRAPQKPKKMMNEREFWRIIELLDRKHHGDDDQILAPAIRKLASRPQRDIRCFEERLAFLLYRLDTKAHAESDNDDPADPHYVSADTFLYTRCAAVARGRRFYEGVLKHPGRMPKDAEFPLLLDLASKANELKTGKESEYASSCNYESF